VLTLEDAVALGEHRFPEPHPDALGRRAEIGREQLPAYRVELLLRGVARALDAELEVEGAAQPGDLLLGARSRHEARVPEVGDHVAEVLERRPKPAGAGVLLDGLAPAVGTLQV